MFIITFYIYIYFHCLLNKGQFSNVRVLNHILLCWNLLRQSRHRNHPLLLLFFLGKDYTCQKYNIQTYWRNWRRVLGQIQWQICWIHERWVWTWGRELIHPTGGLEIHSHHRMGKFLCKKPQIVLLELGNLQKKNKKIIFVLNTVLSTFSLFSA